MKIKLKNDFETTIYKWDVKKPIAVIQVVHGSAEHAKRYENFAKWMNKHQVAVWAIDLRGHGQLAQETNTLGYFGKEGHKLVIKDLKIVQNEIKKTYPNVPYVLLGHSMGSFIVRLMACIYSNEIDYLIAIGTNHQNKIKSTLNYWIASLSCLFLDEKNKARFMDKLSYKSFSKKINTNDKIAWISVNPKNRREFKRDPLCGFTFTRNGFKTMAYWVNHINSCCFMKHIETKTKVLFLSGQDDPVGNMSKEVWKAAMAYSKQNVDTTIKTYPHMRHEVLNEIGNCKVYKDILEFITQKKAAH